MSKSTTTITRYLVTGGGGYLGSILVPMLLKRGAYVKVVDRFFWGKKIFSPYAKYKNLVLIKADTRSCDPKHFKDIDIVIDLAALSNDPIAELKPQITLGINYHARVRTATNAKKMGVKRYILASSCSVYGFNSARVSEKTKPAPITTYAKASLLAEKDTLKLSDENFCVTVLRQGTLYGVSPRMRFDVVLNTMVLSLFKEHSITIEGGNQWRPIVHVKDSATAFIKTSTAKSDKIHGEVFNVGSSKQNYQIKHLAKLVLSTINLPGELISNTTKKDLRSYKVSFKKIQKILKHQPRTTVQMGIKEVYLALRNKEVQNTIKTKTIDWYKHLLSKNTKLLDSPT